MIRKIGSGEGGAARAPAEAPEAPTAEADASEAPTVGASAEGRARPRDEWDPSPATASSALNAARNGSASRTDRPSSVVSVREGQVCAGPPRKMVGQVVMHDGRAAVAPIGGGAPVPMSAASSPPVGAYIEVLQRPGHPQVKPSGEGVLAEAGSARAKLYGILAKHEIDPSFPPEVEAEVEELVAAPGLDDPALEDMTHRPFVTIDNEGSRDLDQALFIERTDSGGFRVFYALADAAHYVRPGTALYAEAQKRGVTLYLPGLAVPMLPPALSEGLVSLNEGVDRRALTMVTELDAAGQVIGSELKRTKIRSRRKLTYEGVQQLHDSPSANPLGNADFTETLRLMKEVGELRIRDADAREVVRINRREVRHGLDPQDPARFATSSRPRNQVEKWNEQISLLCNAEGARLMEASGGDADYVTPIFKVHPEPVAKRLAKFRELVESLVAAHRLEPKRWCWHPEQSLADYLGGLPVDGPQAGVAAAISRQAVMVNSASVFSCDPGLHHGVGVDPYARFSSPMREMVGVYTHKEALEKLGHVQPEQWPSDDPVENQQGIVDLANRAAKLQKRIAKDADRLVLDQHLQEDLQKPLEARPVWSGRILGLTATKAYVQMGEPPFDVKIYLADLEEHFGTELRLDDTRAVARSQDAKVLADLRLGDDISLKLQGYDEDRARYVFRPATDA